MLYSVFLHRVFWYVGAIVSEENNLSIFREEVTYFELPYLDGWKNVLFQASAAKYVRSALFCVITQESAVCEKCAVLCNDAGERSSLIEDSSGM